MFIYLISALTHPLMIWTGPRAQSFYPPQSVFQMQQVAQISSLLETYQISQASVIKMIPTGMGPLLQVTTNERGQKRYFDTRSGQEIENYDPVQAVWLARFYSGRQEPVTSVELITEFSDEYPWVNRLLPVYKVAFETSDNARLFVHTELGAMAGYTNDWKTGLQWVFQKFHAWNWLDSIEAARILVILIFVTGIIALALSGLSFLILMKNKRKLGPSRRLHRTVAYLVIAPLMCLAVSGSIHLIFSSQLQKSDGLKVPKPFHVNADQFAANMEWLERYKDIPLNAISLLPDGASGFVYRLGMPVQQQSVMDHLARFDGLPKEQAGHYYNAQTGELSDLSDNDYVQRIAKENMPVTSKISDITKIKRFGPDYDFRNKRLPVWQITTSDGLKQHLFIDPVTGQVIDQMSAGEKIERYSFSYLHKWDVLVPVIGRIGRDILVFSILFLTMGLAVAGVVLHFTKSSKSKRRK